MSPRREPGRKASRAGRADTRVERFWRQVQKTDGCWLWVGGLKGKGYGKIDTIGAHRFSYELHTGEAPGARHVLHRCDNRICVRPDHLFLGTNDDNVADRVAKGRGVRGETVGCAKLTSGDIRLIRSLCETGESRASVARRFKVSAAHVSNIVLRNTWKHVA